jgi:hypothetical protein
MTPINWTRPIRRVSDKAPARLLGEAKNPLPHLRRVVLVEESPGDETCYVCAEDGTYFEQRREFLENIPEPPHVAWVNFVNVPDKGAFRMVTCANVVDARPKSTDGLLACVRVEWREGQFDD